MIKKYSTLLLLFFINTSVFAQSEIDDISTQSHFELEFFSASAQYFNGQKLATGGYLFSPSITYQHKSGFYFTPQSFTFTDSKILKKTIIPEIDFSIGHRLYSDKFYNDISFSKTFVNYGSTAFRNFLVFALSDYAIYSPSENLDITANAMILFSTSRVFKPVPFFSVGSNYNIYFEDFLGSDLFTLKPGVSICYGSSKISESITNKDTLSSGFYSLPNKVSIQAIQPFIQSVWQKGKSQLEFTLNVPYFKTVSISSTTPTTSEYKFGKLNLYATLDYTYYFKSNKKR